eukprot:s4909_g5.t1
MPPFVDLIECCKIAGTEQWLPQMVEVGVTSPDLVLSKTKELKLMGMPQAMIDVLSIPAKGMATPRSGAQDRKRKDHPTSLPSQGGSMSKALAAAHPAAREAAMQSLKNDVFANSNSGPQASRLRTWKTLASSWGLAPFPLKPETVLAVSASLKAGGYRSARLYFSCARREHVMSHGPIPPEVDLVMNDCTRSIERGQGPSKLKDGFDVDQLSEIDLTTKDEQFLAAYHLVVLGSWFLTREVELSAALRHHVDIDRKKLTVTWSLPVTKTCSRGDLISRTLKCVRHRLPPQLCPFHCMVAHLANTAEQAEHFDQGPLFLEPHRMDHISKQSTIDCIRQVLQAAGVPLTRAGQHRFHGHCLRVSGAQFLNRIGFSPTLVMLIGRWGSQSIMRYLQETPLKAMLNEVGMTATPSPSIPIPTAIPSGAAHIDQATVNDLKADNKAMRGEMDRLKDQLSGLSAELAKMNPEPRWVRGKKTHIPDPAEHGKPPYAWQSKCGWRYGIAKFDRTDDTGEQCRKCFGLAPDKQEPEESSANSASYSSSDSD